MKPSVQFSLSALMCFTFFSAVTQAQNTFEKKYGTSQYEEFWGTVVLSDSTIVHAGYSGSDAYILRTDRYGDTIWTRTITDPGLDLLYSISETQDHGIITAGRSSSYGAGGMDMYLMKLNKAGQVLWRKAIGSADHEVANKVYCCADKGFLLSGYTRPPSAPHNDAHVVKTDSLGNIIWSKAFGGTDDDNAYSIVELSNQDIVVTGLTVNNAPNVMLMKLSSAGVVKWAKIYGTSGDDRAYSIVPGDNGDLYVGGLCENSKLLLFKTDSMGAVIWAKSYADPTTNHWGYSLCRAGLTDLVLCGYQGVSGKGADNILIKVDANGDTLWTRNFGFVSNDYAQSVVAYPAGGFIVSGYSQVSPGDYDLYVIKTDTSGKTSCTDRYAPVQTQSLIFSPGNYIISETSLGSSVAAPAIAQSLGTIQTICESCAAPPVPIDITPDFNKLVCENAVITLSVSASGLAVWYDSPVAGTAVNTGLVFQPGILSAGVYTYYAEALTCRASSKRVAITVTVENCTGLYPGQNLPETNAMVYPNPFFNNAIIAFGKYVLDGELYITDLTGSKVRTIKITYSNQLKIERGNLKSGVYLYEVYEQTRAIRRGKFVLED